MTHDSQAFKRAAKRISVSARRYAAENADQIVRDREENNLSWEKVAATLFRMRVIDKPVKGSVLAQYVRDALEAAGVEQAPRSERAARRTGYASRDGHPLRQSRTTTEPTAPQATQAVAQPALLRAESPVQGHRESATLEKLVDRALPPSQRSVHRALAQEVAQGKTTGTETKATGTAGANPLRAMAEDGTRMGEESANGRMPFVRHNSAAEAERAYQSAASARPQDAEPAPAPAADAGEGAAPAAAEPVVGPVQPHVAPVAVVEAVPQAVVEPARGPEVVAEAASAAAREPEAVVRPVADAPAPVKPKVKIPNLM